MKPRVTGSKYYCPDTDWRTGVILRVHKVHRFSDWGNWVDHNHPQCDICGYVDTTRRLDEPPNNIIHQEWGQIPWLFVYSILDEPTTLP